MQDNTVATIENKEIQGVPSNLIAKAIESGANVESLEKLLALQERWEQKQARKSFLESMSHFQSIVPVLEKKKEVKYPTSRGTTQYKYAPLGEITEAIRKPLKECGLSYRWEIQENGGISVSCIISHVDGHSETTTMSADKDSTGNKNDIQSRGSTITYLQRYTLTTAFGIATADEDNDGRSTAQEVKKEEPKEEDLTAKYEKLFKGKKPDEILDLYKKLPANEKGKKSIAYKLAQFWKDNYEKEAEKEEPKEEIELDSVIKSMIKNISSVAKTEQGEHLEEIDKAIDKLRKNKKEHIEFYKAELKRLKIDYEPGIVPF